MTQLLIVLGGTAGVVMLTFVGIMSQSGGSARSSRKAESLATAFRIHEISSAARSAMWEEVQRNRSGGS